MVRYSRRIKHVGNLPRMSFKNMLNMFSLYILRNCYEWFIHFKNGKKKS
jgi:hypothetical protein